MNVYELICRNNTESITRMLVASCCDTYEMFGIRSDYYKNMFYKEVEKIKETSIPEDRSRIVFVSVSDSQSGLSGYMMKRNELDKIRDAFSFCNPEEFCNPLYGLTFSKRNEILSMHVNMSNIAKYGEESACVTFLSECFSFSVDENKRNSIISEIEGSLARQIKKVLNNGECYDVKELFHELDEKYHNESAEKTIYNQTVQRIYKLKEDTLDVIKSEMEVQ